MTTSSLRFPSCAALSALLALPLAACVEVEDDLELGTVEEEIDGQRYLASDYYTARAVNMGTCTGTIIGPRHVLTALHCNPYRNPVVEVYLAGHPEAADANNPYHVARWYSPAGTSYSYNPSQGLDEYDQTDTNGDIADMMILVVDRDFSRVRLGMPPTHPPATLAWTYPGDDVSGVRIGAGNHDDASNPDGVLYMNVDTTYSSDDDGAWFILDDNHVNPGDSGGPFYVDTRVVGTLKGFWGLQTRYMSVPARLPWILGVIGYKWPGQAPFDGMLTGTMSTIFASSAESVCGYACDKTTGCVGYNFSKLGMCQLFSAVTGSFPGSSHRAARRFPG